MAKQFTIPTSGDTIAGKYLIQEELGRGSYGVVFRARHIGVDRDVALKTLLPQAFLQTDIVERFQREAAMISRLTHPNIVTLYDFGEADGVLYMAMEFLEGKQINHLIKEEAPLSVERALHITKQVLAALKAAHKKGIIHRDLKPENIILCDIEEERDVVKVLDFGIAKMTEIDELGALKTLTIQGYVLGTPHYMSPEAITGEHVDTRADLYAVGLLLYEMLTGEHPFHAHKPSAVMMKHLNDPVPTLPDPKIEKSHIGYALRLALAKEPEDRMASAIKFIEILDGLHEPPSKPWRSAEAMMLLVGVLALVLALLSWGLLSMSNESNKDKSQTLIADVGNQEDTKTRTAGSAADAGSDASHAQTRDTSKNHPEKKDTSTTVAKSLPTQKAKNTTQETHNPVRTSVFFASEPSQAQVIVNGRPTCTTPCKTTVDGEAPIKIIIKKIGFRARTMSLRPTGSKHNVNVRLKPGRIKLAP